MGAHEADGLGDRRGVLQHAVEVDVQEVFVTIDLDLGNRASIGRHDDERRFSTCAPRPANELQPGPRDILEPSVELRPHISSSFLLAQLAANYEIRHSGGGPREWYDQSPCYAGRSSKFCRGRYYLYFVPRCHGSQDSWPRQ